MSPQPELRSPTGLRQPDRRPAAAAGGVHDQVGGQPLPAPARSPSRPALARPEIRDSLSPTLIETCQRATTARVVKAPLAPTRVQSAAGRLWRRQPAWACESVRRACAQYHKSARCFAAFARAPDQPKQGQAFDCAAAAHEEGSVLLIEAEAEGAAIMDPPADPDLTPPYATTPVEAIVAETLAALERRRHGEGRVRAAPAATAAVVVRWRYRSLPAWRPS